MSFQQTGPVGTLEPGGGLGLGIDGHWGIPQAGVGGNNQPAAIKINAQAGR